MPSTTRLLSLAIASALAAGARGESFTIVALPDTQNYVTSASNSLLFEQQTQWIADQVQQDGNPRNIQFVTHLGDMVSDGDNLLQTARAVQAMNGLHGVVPYSTLPGNHDYASTGNKSTGADVYEANFGPARYESFPWFGGADPSGLNSYQLFNAGGQEFLHLALEWQPTVNSPFRETSPIDWAQSVLDAYPDTPVILSTHEHVDDSPPGRSSAGDALWDQLVRRNDQVFLVLNGHYHSAGGSNDGEYHQVSTNDAGRPVFEVLQDYQDYPRGGDGWLRLIEFDIAGDAIRFETFSPVLNEFQTETVDQVGQFASQFDLAIDFSDRLVPVEVPPEPFDPTAAPTFRLRNGALGYSSAIDKEIRSSGGDLSNGENVSISVDGDDGPGTAPNQGLIRFEDLQGFVADLASRPADQIEIASATLVLEITNPGSGFTVHDMLVAWDESSTWSSLGGGVQPNGIEAESAAVASLEDIGVGTLEIDVTESVEAWLAGEQANLGWALIPFLGGNNGVDFHTTEFQGVELRPTLDLFTHPGDFDLDGDADAEDYAVWQADYSTTDFSLADANRDGVVDAADYTIWRDAVAAQAASVPEPSATMLIAASAIALFMGTKRAH